MVPSRRHGEGRRAEPAAEQRRCRRTSPRRSRPCGPTCCSRRPRKACGRSSSRAPGPGEGKSIVASQPRDRAGAGGAARAADRRGHAPAARPRDLRGRPGAGAVERADRQREDQRGHPQIDTAGPVAASARVTFRRTRPSCSGRSATPISSDRFRTTSTGSIIDTPPVLVVADSSIVANEASGVVFVVGADKTSRQAARAAIEQLDAASAQ